MRFALLSRTNFYDHMLYINDHMLISISANHRESPMVDVSIPYLEAISSQCLFACSLESNFIFGCFDAICQILSYMTIANA